MNFRLFRKISLKALLLSAFLIVFAFTASCQTQVPTNTSETTVATTAAVTSTGATSATTTESTTTQGTTQSSISVADYFPLLPDVCSQYAGIGNEFVPMTTWVDYVGSDTIQIAYDNSGTVVRKLYGIQDGMVVVLKQQAEMYMREDLSIQIPDVGGEILLMEPLIVGTSWDHEGKTRTITAIDTPVSTPAGEFNAVEVTMEENLITTRYYYAPDIGLVKMTIVGEYEITQELSERTVPCVKTNTMTFFYPHQTETVVEIMYMSDNVALPTNTDMVDVLEQFFKAPVDATLIPLISEETTIHSMSIDMDSHIATIDFSEELVTDMNVGADMESAILRCIVNTVGQAYGIPEVVVTLDGGPYISGHIIMGPGDTFTVDYENMVEFT